MTVLQYPWVKMGSFTALLAVISYVLFNQSTSLKLWTSFSKHVKRRNTKDSRKVSSLPSWAKDLALINASPKMLEELNRRKRHEMWNTVLFFPDLLPNRADAPFKQLLHYFKQAKSSIYLCMYLCSHWDVSGLLKKKYDEGLVVYVITDFDTWTAHNNSGFHFLAHNGIPIKLNINGSLMHNKFALIDEEAVLTGSLNWTKQGVQSNNENVMVTTDPRIVSKYLQEFNKLFALCKNEKEIFVRKPKKSSVQLM